jgi:hypothetical protein
MGSCSLSKAWFCVSVWAYRATKSALTEIDAPETRIGSERTEAERNIEAVVLNEIICANLLTLTQIFNFSNLLTNFGEVASWPAAGILIM